MAVVDVYNNQAEKISQAELTDAVFNVPVKPSVMHEVVKCQLASRRAGTASVKHRSDVSGSRHKLFRQKGTGRARRGDIKSPLLRGGGSVFGPDPRSYAYAVPKKVRKQALRMALSSKLQNNELVVLDTLDLAQPKTRAFASVLTAFELSNVLIVIDGLDENLNLSSRNVPGVKVLQVAGLNVYDVLKHKKVILLESSIKAIEGRLAS